MPKDKVTVFTPVPLTINQKIRIEGTPRGGDWLVIGLSESKVRLKCPVSGREVEWARFCYQTEECLQEWPKQE
ncbi:MAG: hypothetical protein OEY01_09070 [Desulfobulbaceae bacterium]|nr:hypothetical protein [Desulfobulbaceae bacterium]HIJ79153.1 hypothetical protein [Deltaproteobacteria bacterium]